MTPPRNVREIYLKPGEHFFGSRESRIRTILGSCVAITLWHPRKRIGGMCHFMLPSRGTPPPALDGRYADEALALLLEEVQRQGAAPREFEVKLFGGGNMFGPLASLGEHVGKRNIEAAHRLIRAQGLEPVAESLGGCVHRNLIFEVWSGNVWQKQGHPLPSKEVHP